MDTKQALGARTSLIPFLCVAWQHEFLHDRYATSSLQFVSGYDFTTHGARSWCDAARIEMGLNLLLLDGRSIDGKFTGVFSDTSRGIAGTGGFPRAV
ncbi:autotransporter outer membrane beta-barrel domain-containing protein [Komagataeibacter nataicola]|nr:autotransporter outer membrane beta-barrel domain-containing protein [Komagataeibacter nataicola]WNM08867.1 autotransporter outer membrane beta-barrel domain-containing protein [Komagataeibacter nataicola]